MISAPSVGSLLELIDSGVWGSEDTVGGISILRSTNFGEGGEIDYSNLAIKAVPEKERVRKALLPGDILIEKSGGGPKQPVGRVAYFRGSRRNHVFGNFVARLRTKSELCHPRYLFWFLLRAHEMGLTEAYQKQTTGIRNLELKRYLDVKIPLPPLDEQRRIVGLLDRAAEIRRRADAARAKARAIIPALFLDMFGDPATNPKGWPLVRIRTMAVKISDGPFGSNLKSSHYSKIGVRVWRLQNVGVGKLLDDDRAFVPFEHYEKLKKHTCLPGDVIIGTLGEPNLRAFVQPPTVELAINKSDCVQFRCDLSLCLPQFVSGLMNQPGMLDLCRGQITGQTRSRISMGRLRDIDIPLPPLKLQEAFEQLVQRIDGLAIALDAIAAKAEAMAAALSAEVFG